MRLKYDFSSLTIEQACDGARVCIDNAKRLVEQSKLLLDNSLLELAIVAACTAIEEAGKAFLLLAYRRAKARGENDAYKRLGDSFCCHPEKYRSALKECEYVAQLFELVIQGVNSENIGPEAASRKFLNKVRTIMIPDATHQATGIFGTRNEMLYTVFKDGKFSSPKDKGRKSQYEELVVIAENSIDRAELVLTISLKCIKTGVKEDPKSIIEESMTFFIERLKNANLVFKKKSAPARLVH